MTAETEREEMLELRAQLLAAHPEIKMATQLAPLMGKYEQAYWEWSLDRLIDQWQAQDRLDPDD